MNTVWKERRVKASQGFDSNNSKKGVSKALQ